MGRLSISRRGGLRLAGRFGNPGPCKPTLQISNDGHAAAIGLNEWDIRKALSLCSTDTFAAGKEVPLAL